MTWFRSNKSDPVKRSPGAQLRLPVITKDMACKLGTINAAQGIFLIFTQKEEFLVLKREREAVFRKDEFTPATRMMGLVQKLRAEPLSDAEVAIIQTWRVPGNPDFANALQQAANNPQEFWTKSTYVPHEKNMRTVDKPDSYLNASEDEKKERIAQLMKLAKRLSGNKRAWTQLGEIAAVDNFNGNQDRFYFVNEQYNPGQKYVTNFGNVMFREKSGRFGVGKTVRAVGLDAFDPNGARVEDGYNWPTEFRPFLQVDTNRDGVNRALGNIYQCMKDRIEGMTGNDLDWKDSNLDAMKKGYFGAVETMKKAVKSTKLGLSETQGKKVKALGWA